MWTIVLLIASNVFMTFAWYAHLKFTETALWRVILASWGIAFFEYCLQVPANRMGVQSGFTGYQLKLMQEVITLAVFVIFAMFYLKEPPKWNYIVSIALIIGGAYFAFLPAK